MTLFTKVIHLQKTLNQTNCYTTEKIDCFVVELDNDNDEMKNKNNFFNIQQLVNFMSSFFWNLILFFSQNVKVFLHSS